METLENVQELEMELKQIEKWEREQRDLMIWDKLSRLPFMLLDKLTPKFLHAKIGQALDEVGNYVQSGGKYIVSEQAVLDMFRKAGPAGAGMGTEDLLLADVAALPLREMDRVAGELKTSRAKIATVQGASTGIGGLFTLAIDIPFVLGLSLKVLQEVAMCYGFDPNDRKERAFIVKCLQFSSSDIVGKQAVLAELAVFDGDGQVRSGGGSAMSDLQGWREALVAYRDNFGWKKLFQMIPIAGILFGAFLNKSLIEDIAETGIMLYRKRRIKEKLKSMADASIEGC